MRTPASLFIFLFLLANANAQFGFGGSSKAKVTTVADVETIQAGVPFYAGVRIEHEGNWHTYWKNAGNDFSQPTTVTWDLPEGFTAGPLLFSIPHYELNDGITSYVYSGTVYHAAKITPPDDLAPGTEITIKGTLKILVCREEECEPPTPRDLSITLKASDAAPTPSAEAPAIEAMLDDSPLRLPKWTTEAAVDGDKIIITATAPEGETIPEAGLYFFPDKRGLIEDGKDKQQFEIEGNQIKITASKGEDFDGSISGLLSAEDGIGSDGAHAIVLDTADTEDGSDATTDSAGNSKAEAGTLAALTPAESAEIRLANDKLAARVLASLSAGDDETISTESPDGSTEKASKPEPKNPLMLMLGGAFLGGMILNLMPCVFPVLGIKIMGFVSQAGEDKAKIRRHGLVFAVGVLISMWVLVAVLVGLKIFYEKSVPWGFQLQNPTFLAIMILLMFAFALNLCGLFEIGTSLTGAGSDLQQKHGYSGSFFSGVLAVLVATPCTGPFMGPAIGFALTSNPASTFAVFTALALGLALPYVILSFFPALIQKLPKPGAWMETFKQFMAFPLLGMVIWLIGVFAKISGITALGYLLFGMLIFGFALWIYGRFATPFAPKGKKFTARLAAVAVVGVAGWFTLTAIQARQGSGSFAKPVVKHGITFSGFDPRELVTALESGRGVFIDFTADW